MKVFISQKMRGKTSEQILTERFKIEEECLRSGILGVYVGPPELETATHFIRSYKPELAFKDPITSLSQSLAMLAEADIVLVPKLAYVEVEILQLAGSEEFIREGGSSEQGFNVEYIRKHIGGCELELLVALAYGKKVYYYDVRKTEVIIFPAIWL